MAVSGQVVGHNASITITDSGCTVRNVGGDTNTVTLSWPAETPENTAYGDSYRQRLGGLKDWTIDYSGFFNDAANTGIHTVLANLVGGPQTDVVFGPAGSTSGYLKVSGCGIVTEYSSDTPVDGMVTVSFTMVASAGSLTRGVYA